MWERDEKATQQMNERFEWHCIFVLTFLIRDIVLLHWNAA